MSRIAKEQFDRYLGSYQKICVFLLFPGLLSAFSCTIKMFSAEYPMTLTLSIVHFFDGFMADWNYGFLLLISLVYLAISILCTLLAAKGKLPFYILGSSLLAIDFVFFFLRPGNEVIQMIMAIALHVIFLAVYVIGGIYYYKADKLLKEKTKDIVKGK